MIHCFNSLVGSFKYLWNYARKRPVRSDHTSHLFYATIHVHRISPFSKRCTCGFMVFSINFFKKSVWICTQEEKFIQCAYAVKFAFDLFHKNLTSFLRKWILSENNCSIWCLCQCGLVSSRYFLAFINLVFI